MTEEVRFSVKPLVITTTIYVGVLLIGAAVFMAVERDSDSLQPAKHPTVLEIAENITDKYNMSVEDVKKLTDAILRAEEEREAAGKPNWSYSNSVFFAFTIMTTIGKVLRP